MALTLNHFSIRTTDLEASRRFYADVLGLSVGPRPPFPFPGLWMYRGPHDDMANAVVHLIGLDPQDPAGPQRWSAAARSITSPSSPTAWPPCARTSRRRA